MLSPWINVNVWAIFWLSYSCVHFKDPCLCIMNYPFEAPTFVVKMGNEAVVLPIFAGIDCELHPLLIGTSTIMINQVGEGLSHKIACFFIQPVNT